MLVFPSGSARRRPDQPARLLQLQRTAGNTATGRLLQRVLVGVDPLVDLERDARGLIYGVIPARDRKRLSSRTWMRDWRGSAMGR